MENNSNKRILFAILFVLFFAVVIIIWYFFYAKPVIAPSLTETNNPFPTQKLPPRFQFLNWGQDDTSTTTTEIIDPLSIPLVRVWDKPATGQTFIKQTILKEIIATSTVGTTTVETRKSVRASSTVLMFVDRATGYVYGYPVETGKPYQISNTIFPGIYDANIFNEGKKIMMRYVDQDKNRVVGVIANIPNVQDNEMALPLTNIQYISSKVTSMATNATHNEASYVVTSDNGSAIYTLASKGPSLVASSPFSEWLLSYGGDALYVTPKASAYVPGVTLSVPSFSQEVSEKTGLMSNPGPGGIILNSMWGVQGLATFLSNNGEIKMVNAKTLASKCAWGDKKFLVCGVPKLLPRQTEGLPDDWFQGRVSFDDDLYIIDPNTGDRFPLYTFKNEDGVFDVTNISFTQDKTLLSFTKKQDASLWMLNLNLLGSE